MTKEELEKIIKEGGNVEEILEAQNEFFSQFFQSLKDLNYDDQKIKEILTEFVDQIQNSPFMNFQNFVISEQDKKQILDEILRSYEEFKKANNSKNFANNSTNNLEFEDDIN
ncbi:hypothetical protein [Metamycoplasma canadense]|uniref:hypothetical protein n=1 Tax=Metamycoplasma canadense TaxID=29554 RepID=UPI0005EF3D25|nr:hypothetical protein [Metamycoplasma canadense]